MGLEVHVVGAHPPGAGRASVARSASSLRWCRRAAIRSGAARAIGGRSPTGVGMFCGPPEDAAPIAHAGQVMQDRYGVQRSVGTGGAAPAMEAPAIAIANG
jgi:hypothetical protein